MNENLIKLMCPPLVDDITHLKNLIEQKIEEESV
jgi:hypothetical protein